MNWLPDRLCLDWNSVARCLAAVSGCATPKSAMHNKADTPVLPDLKFLTGPALKLDKNLAKAIFRYIFGFWLIYFTILRIL
jgi:hypothetical protein